MNEGRPPVEPGGATMPDGESVAPGWAVRLEAKVDVALAQHGARLDNHERRLAGVETSVQEIRSDPRVDPALLADHETRLREQEKKSTVSPRTLATTVVGVLGAIGAVSPFLDRLYTT